MKNWNDIYQSVKAGEMDEKLKMMGCEDMAAGRDRAVHVLESFKECFGTKEDTPGDAVLSAWSNRDLR